MSDLTLWERIRIRIAYWLLPWDEPDTLTSLLEARADNAALKRGIREIVDGEDYYKGKESANDYDATIEGICEELDALLKEHGSA